MLSEDPATGDEKIDQLVATIAELRKTIRVCLWTIVTGFSLVLMALTLLVSHALSLPDRLDRLGQIIAVVRGDTIRLASRMDRYEQPKSP